MKTTRNLLSRLSYHEIAEVAIFLDHNDINQFRRLSRACNYAACKSIIDNLQTFQNKLDNESYKNAGI